MDAFPCWLGCFVYSGCFKANHYFDQLELLA